MLDPKFFQPQNYFLIQKNFRRFFRTQYFLAKIIFDQQFLVTYNFFRGKNLSCPQNCFGSIIFFGPKIYLDPNFFCGSKMFFWPKHDIYLWKSVEFQDIQAIPPPAPSLILRKEGLLFGRLWYTSASAQLMLRLTHLCSVARSPAETCRLANHIARKMRYQKNETGHHLAGTGQAFNKDKELDIGFLYIYFNNS